MSKQPTKLREWRVSIMRDKVRYLGRVVASDKQSAIDKATEEFRIFLSKMLRGIQKITAAVQKTYIDVDNRPVDHRSDTGLGLTKSPDGGDHDQGCTTCPHFHTARYSRVCTARCDGGEGGPL